jgi:hypothetical protein
MRYVAAAITRKKKRDVLRNAALVEHFNSIVLALAASEFTAMHKAPAVPFGSI